MWRLLADIDPRYRESAEESLVETAHLMAAQIEQRARDGRQRSTRRALEPLFRDLYARELDAEIFGFRKTRIELRVAVVDAQGSVLFDSLQPRAGRRLFAVARRPAGARRPLRRAHHARRGRTTRAAR